MTIPCARVLLAALFAVLICVMPATGTIEVWIGQAMQIPLRDFIGYFAAGLVLATFCVKSMNTLRVLAIASNVAFATYGYLAELTPVLLLHAILLPVNGLRLTQVLCARREMLRAALSGHAVSH